MTDSPNDKLPPPIDNASDIARIDVARYLHVLRKRVWVIAATVAVVVTATVVYTLRLQKQYMATATVVIDPTPPDLLGGEVKEVVQLGAQTVWANLEYNNTQLTILKSRELARRTVVRHSLHEDPRIVPPREDDTRSVEDKIATAAGLLRSRIEARVDKNSRIARISVVHPNPEVAALLANAHTETYLDYTLSLRTSGSRGASKWLASELDQAEASLRESESHLYEYKKANDILSVSLEDKQNILAADIQRYTEGLSNVRARRIDIEAIRQRALAIRDVDVLESAIFGLTESTTGRSLKAAYVEENRKLTAMGEQLGPKFPEYAEQKRKVDSIIASLERERDLVLQEIEERYQAVLATERSYERELERLKTEAFELGPKAVEYNRIRRKHNHDENNYNIVFGRLRASELSGRQTTTNIRPLDSAVVPRAHVYPRMQLNVVLAVAASLVLGMALAFLIEFLDRTIKNVEELEQWVPAPVLGVIPIVPDAELATGGEGKGNRDLHVFRHPSSRAAECCRSIRTNILFSAAERELQTLTVVSANPREGKTTTALYLGQTMAQSGQRVLIFDTDMRRPRLHKTLGVSRNKGLSNLILGDVEADDVIKTTDIPNLYVIPCGPTPPNPAELLLTNRFKAILEEMSTRFDRILLDSPPLLAVTDAVILSKVTDGVIMVAQAGRTIRDAAARAYRMVHDVDSHIVGVVLNEMDLTSKKYGYGSYYYAYGYSESSEPGAESSV